MRLAKSATTLIAAGCANAGRCQTSSLIGVAAKRAALYACHSFFLAAHAFSQFCLAASLVDVRPLRRSDSALAITEMSPLCAVVWLLCVASAISPLMLKTWRADLSPMPEQSA